MAYIGNSSSAGQVLESAGAGATSHFVTEFSPNSKINLGDDFMGSGPFTPLSGTSALSGSLTWGGGNSFVQLATTENGHPGILGLSAGVTGGAANLYLSASSGGSTILSPLILGGGLIQLNWVIKINTLSNGTNRYSLRIGLGDTLSAVNGDQVNGVYFEYSDNINSGNWNYKTASSSSRTTSNSAVAVTTGWHNLGITINAAASSISFTVDGVSLGAAITTNIPTAAITIMERVEVTVGTATASSILTDLMYYTQTLTSAR